MKYKLLTLFLAGMVIISALRLSGQSQYLNRTRYFMDKGIVAPSTINPALHHATDKKLILTSQSLKWEYARDHIASMEAAHPYFDGIATWVRKPMMRGESWTEEDVELKTMSQIKWGKYTENFVIVGYSDSQDFEFFNEAKWSSIIHNTRLVSKMVKAGSLKGVFIDDENYAAGSHGWKFDPAWYPGHTFEQVYAKSRERGREVMKALQSEVAYPLVVLDFIWYGDHWNRYDTKDGRQILWMAFKDGMLDAARKEDVLVDGNEVAYYYQEAQMFTDICNEFRQHCFPKYGAPELQEKYRTQVQIGHGIYPTLMYGWCNIKNHASFPDRAKYPTYTDEENSAWWKHQLYHSLLTTDKYVWLWSEKWNWWGDETEPLPSDMASILTDVKARINSQQGLDYEMTKFGPNWASLTPSNERWHFSVTPTVRITGPANKSVTSGDFTIHTEVSTNISKVEFYINSLRVGVIDKPPFTLRVTGLKKGTYTLFARVFDGWAEGHTTSAPVIFSVND